MSGKKCRVKVRNAANRRAVESSVLRVTARGRYRDGGSLESEGNVAFVRAPLRPEKGGVGQDEERQAGSDLWAIREEDAMT